MSRCSALILAGMAALSGCHSVPAGMNASDAGSSDGGPPFEPLSAANAVAKAKNLLTGLPPTDEEVAQVVADPTALHGLVAQWITQPEYTAKMQTFFATAFQQSQATSADYQALGAVPGSMVPGLNESFARTVIELLAEGRPFTDVYTTQRFMLTPALMVQYAMLDESPIGDDDKAHDQILQSNPNFTFTLESSKGAIPISETLDPTSPNYMVWYDPTLNASFDPLCPNDPIVYKTQKHQQSVVQSLFEFLVGKPGRFVVPSTTEANGVHNCQPPSVGTGNAYITGTDYTQWKMVTIRPPNAGEATTVFYDLPAIRAATELVLKTPRVGFFTTPSFFAQWQTNMSNQARVTANQTLITGLGKQIDFPNVTTPPSLAALDTTHAVPQSTCFGCHQSLDPMRQFFRQDYTLYFSPQTDAAETSLQPSFGFLGVSQSGSSILDLANILASHPRVATAWTQKLCTWANSAPCSEDDPEFVRIATAFASSNFKWDTLVLELMSSPIVSYLSDTATTDANGETFPIARQAHLCAALSNRLGIADICGLSATTKVPSKLKVVQTIAATLQSDQYGRGAEAPILANDPSLTFRAGLENICAAVAEQVVDNGSTSRYSSSQSDAAIADFVHNLMGIPTSQDATPISILQGHFTSAKAAGTTPSDALRSTFVVACLSPAVAGMGQ